jgi:hypothetical protein
MTTESPPVRRMFFVAILITRFLGHKYPWSNTLIAALRPSLTLGFMTVTGIEIGLIDCNGIERIGKIEDHNLALVPLQHRRLSRKTNW